MEAHIDHLTPIALVSMVALCCGLLFIRMRQPALVGYIMAGAVLGPTGFSLVENTDIVKTMAEMGVIMLLFLIGMELSLRGFQKIYKVSLGTAIGQILLFWATFAAVGVFFNWDMQTILLLTFCMSLSSTAVAIKILEETEELMSDIGRTTVGVLIAQDLAVIPMLLLVNSFGQDADANVGYIIFIKLCASIGLIAFFAWFLSRSERLNFPFIELFEKRPDILPLSALAFCFMFATISGAMGLSTAYGAFLAGLIIGNSNMRQMVHQSVDAIQSVLLMIFFLSVGLLIDLHYVMNHWGLVLFGVLSVTVIKTLYNILILFLTGVPFKKACHIGVIIGQVGEFSFILVAAGLATEVITDEHYRLMIAIIALSLMTSPFCMGLAQYFHRHKHRKYLGMSKIIGKFIDLKKEKPDLLEGFRAELEIQKKEEKAAAKAKKKPTATSKAKKKTPAKAKKSKKTSTKKAAK